MSRTSPLPFVSLALAMVLGPLAWGCDSDGGEAEASEPSAAAVAEAQSIFAARCVPCHGESGAGDGSASAGLNPQPRNFQESSWQQSVTDEHIEKIIQFGGAAVDKSPAMPANPDLQGKPEVVAALRKHVRSLGE